MPAHTTRSDHSRRGCPSASGRRGERREWERDRGITRAAAQRCNRYDRAGEVEAWWQGDDDDAWTEHPAGGAAPHPSSRATTTNGSARRRSRRERAAKQPRLALPPTRAGTIALSIDDAQNDVDYDLISEPGSEWSVVSSAETSWTLPGWHDVGAPGAPWPETGDDAAIALALQHEEQRSFIAVYPVVRGGGLSGGSPCALPPDEAERLEERLGVCVICSESVATVLMEPCGHLAMCGGCHDSWAAVGDGAYGRLTCAMCRTPGNAIHLLGETSEYACGVNVRLLDGRVCVPSLDPIAEDERAAAARAAVRAAARAAARPSSSRVDDATRALAAASHPSCHPKLRYRQQLRFLTRQARARTRAHGAAHLGAVQAGGLLGRRAQEAEAAVQWRKHGELLAAWKGGKASTRALARSAQLADVNRSYSWRGRSFCAPPWCGAVEVDVRARRLQAKRQLQWRERHADPPRPDCVRVGAHYLGGRGGFGYSWMALPGSRARGSSALAEATWGHVARHSAAVRKADLRKAIALAAEEKAAERGMRSARGREARELALAAVAGARRVAAAPRECVACGEAEACMLALPCRHTALCRTCWEGRERRGEACAQCGGPCSVSICVHRP